MARANASRTDRRSTRSHKSAWTVVSGMAAVGVAVCALALESSEPTPIRPEVGLIIMAVAAGFLASVTTTPAGTTIVINPAVCFSFAALLSHGLAPAIVAQLASVLAVHWRTGRSLRRSIEKAVQFSASLLAAAGVIDVVGFASVGRTGSWATPTGALVVVAAIVAWLMTYVGVGLVLELPNRDPPRFHAARDPADRTQAANSGRTSGALLRDYLGFLLPSKAALLALGPFLAIAADVNVALLPLALVPLAAVQQMFRLSADRARESRLDPLTSLANRTMLQESFDRMASEPQRSLRPDGRVALLVVDLDGFKNVNDSLGHEVGDDLLKVVAGRLKDMDAATTGQTVVGRLGGDEFAILTRVRDIGQARRLAEQVSVVVGKPVRLNELVVDVTASIGIALRESSDKDFSAILRNADRSMYEAKRQSNAISVYHPGHVAGQPDSLRLLAEFRHSLESPNGGISLHYQPQIVLRTGEIEGVEALFRWTHPERGPIEPRTILEIVENTSTMRLLTARVIDEATAQLAAWRRARYTIRVSINVSARDLYTEEIADRIAERLSYHDIPPELLQVEVTESAVSTDPDRAAAVLKRIADLGVAVSLDDFGTGYSSLHHLRRLPIKEIKIDGSFIGSMLTHTGDGAIVMSTIIMAQALRLRTVAEGIPDDETQECLFNLGCDLGQGFHIAPPVPASEIRLVPRR